MEAEVLLGERGRKATFLIQVQFRQNTSWQGTISWIEEQKKRHFTSELEMIRLMDQAVAAYDMEVQKW